MFNRFLLVFATLAVASLFLLGGCSKDVEVERTKLPHIDKPASDIKAE
jgi:hypothetical protein